MADDERPMAAKNIKINYIKSGNFREIACDGVLGGPTPQGKIWFAFYTERFPMPQVVEQLLVEGLREGELSMTGEPVVLQAREGIIRNVEFGVYMNFSAAEQLRDWLIDQLKNNPDKSK
jgi:hypothetical protein